MKMHCPHCGVKGSADDSYVGKIVRCPKCEATFEVLLEEISTAVSSETEVQDILEPSTSSVEEEVVAESAMMEADEKQEEILEWSDVAVELDQDSSERALTGGATGVDEESGEAGVSPGLSFSVGSVLKEAWRETKGAKSSILAANGVMYLVLIVLSAVGTFLIPYYGAESLSPVVVSGSIGITQVLVSIFSVIFTAGLLYMGVRKVAGDVISWKMVFRGFSFSGQIILATLLQMILIGIGLLLLVLPGIYLMVGYGLTLPLILDKNMSAWEAMETSRKAIHKVWWKVTGAVIVMSVIYSISVIPLMIGLIWTVPMFLILGGVLYRHLFGVEKNG